MLAVTLVMAVAFLALSKRERGSVTTGTDSIVAQNAARSAVENALAQINAGFLSGSNNLVSSNAYNLSLIVSTNYINPSGFATGSSNPTNVNYLYGNGSPLTDIAPTYDREHNISNLWFLPRAPVFVPTNLPNSPLAYDFRYYLDLNENGRFERYGYVPQIGPNGGFIHPDGTEDNNPVNVVTNLAPGGDPEWVGVLEHPDMPHGPNNHFTSRYAFIAVPVGNTMDINYIHNQSRNTSLTANDGYTRNQGVGSWEINLAAFFADLNTNIWYPVVAPNNTYYTYNEPSGNNSGIAFQDAFSLLKYRYNYLPLPSANNLFANAGITFPNDGIDDYSQGPLQTTLDFNEDSPSTVSTVAPWSGADNPNHFFTLNDFFNGSTPATFANHLRRAASYNDTYDRYTFYRMLNELGTDSSAEEGKLDLNYSNAVVSTNIINGVRFEPGAGGIGIVPNAETNLVRWRPLDFFAAAGDQMLRTYSSYWYSQNPVAYTNTFRLTNSFFSITNIPVWVSNRFVYTPAVHRLLQLAANIYDATTNGNYNLPHVFKPILERLDNNGDIFIVGYKEVTYVTGPQDLQLQNPYAINQLTNFPSFRRLNSPITGIGGEPVNVYGVPWIIGAKQGLPNFNQLSVISAAQVTRKLEVQRSSLNPATARYQTNEMYIMGISNNVGLSFWNSYSNNYAPRTGSLRVYAADVLYMNVSNGNAGAGYNTPYGAPFVFNFVTNNVWPGSQWYGTQPNTVPNNPKSFISVQWPYFFPVQGAYNFSTGTFDVGDAANADWWPISSYPQLDQINLLVTNYLQAYILDGNNVIDYVQLQDPTTQAGLNQALADPNYGVSGNTRYQWSTNTISSPPSIPWGLMNQIVVSENSTLAPAVGGQWDQAATPMGSISPAAEAAYFRGFFQPTFQYLGQTYVNHQLVTQAPYTPSRTVFVSYLLQANDPLVHYTGSDLNSQVGTLAKWGNQSYYNGVWTHSDDPAGQPLPGVPGSPIGGRYQPWGHNGQMAGMSGVDINQYNLAYKDPLVWGSDYWDFSTNLYPTVGWLGRVHRGTPWQTVYLKSTNVLSYATRTANGFQTWANWTGNIQTNIYTYYFDNANSAPQQDYLLFDIFTTRFNDNAVRGTLPVNVGAGSPDGGLAAWSALFSGMVVLSNNAPLPSANTPLSYTSLIINPAGTDAKNSPLWKIVNDPRYGINATRTNTSYFPYQTFAHVGQILATPALSVASPFLNTNAPLSRQIDNGINDEMYEWLPQQMMGLVRTTEPRYVLYCFGQTLRPAPNGTVLSGPYFQMVTNYQVVAESAVRAVIRVDGANTSKPHAVMESYNVLPPN